MKKTPIEIKSRDSQAAYAPAGTLVGTVAPNMRANALSLMIHVVVFTVLVAAHFIAEGSLSASEHAVSTTFLSEPKNEKCERYPVFIPSMQTLLTYAVA